jgi:hypothetical protein
VAHYNWNFAFDVLALLKHGPDLSENPKHRPLASPFCSRRIPSPAPARTRGVLGLAHVRLCFFFFPSFFLLFSFYFCFFFILL